MQRPTAARPSGRCRYPSRMISRDQYDRRAEEQDDWAPGWEAIEQQFAVLYPGVEPRHMASAMAARAVFGGDVYLDGASLYPSARGYQHIVSFGLSALYADVEAYGAEHSGWGYELTAKVAASSPDDALWMVDVMSNLARYTFTSRRFFQPYDHVAGGEPIRQGSASALTSLLVVPDTEITGVESVHGRLDFLQLVGITSAEAAWLSEDPAAARERGRALAARLVASGNTALMTDLGRASII